MHPAHVIDDPALMLSFMCVVAAVGTVMTGVSPARLDRIVQRHRLSRWLASSLGSRRNTESDTESTPKTTTAESAMRTRPSVDSFG